MKNEVIIDNFGLGHIIAIKENGVLIDLFVDPINTNYFYPSGTVLTARIDRRVSKAGGYFLKLPNNKQGFLRSKRKYKEGQLVRVCAKVFIEEGKAQKFSDVIKLKTTCFLLETGSNTVKLSHKIVQEREKERLIGLGKHFLEEKECLILFRSESVKFNNKDLEENFLRAFKDFSQLTSYNEISDKPNLLCLSKKIVLEDHRFEKYKVFENEGCFEALGIWDEIHEISKKKVYYGKGCFLYLEQTRALLSIDINTGNDFKINSVDANEAAIETIFKLIKIRGFGGRIVIDFLPCRNHDKMKLLKKVKSIFSNSYFEHFIYGWTKSRLFELEIERKKIPLELVFKNN